jgi:hypothetical protein
MAHNEPVVEQVVEQVVVEPVVESVRMSTEAQTEGPAMVVTSTTIMGAPASNGCQ